ncbi:asparagine synthase [Alkalihalobacillus alcalophilus ATCC 27647 = CGMCC 1.3604]|uniref:asparagine synthase (glutamine-hydrolyzing) n=1 Tax=Alkalihalobacillus alcalophilus ATCC 27647 = CGMCC 1.3604 TaxID=1218173 RepID=A0A4S4K208_ALKAL|nr:asparagine synthase (glutamine-hydrolyzing) [Alkalihalobacillus alcalophilus]MED1562843.1 asparagine synthase (glutamine-hydrolyzing) [Alkalihalobacillus alcalophilus]THG90019.1 asparagine synthase [Alkalihalobacillus alcalophilus ATCC 27647 = CGMCC 1.3604]
MCGFLGEISLKNNLIEREQFELALEQINHRGPDSTGIYEDKNVRLGFKRLSIIDLEHGSQPLAYQDGRYQIIFNGEVYNYIELRDHLMKDGYTFQTHTDTEVIVALYAQKGVAAIQELRGMFGFVIWDKEKHELIGARDRFGIKPFYYYESDSTVLFASELKSIHQCVQPLQVNKTSLQNYMSFQFVPEPATVFEEVQKLKPGHYFVKKENKPMEIKPYYEIGFKNSSLTLDEHIQKIRHVLEDSVAKHMRSDVPVGAFLSGGIDSTTTVALAKRHNENLKTFTVGFEQHGYSEIEVAKESARQLDVENIHKYITAEEFLRELPNIIWHMDEPVADPAAIPLYFVAKEASKHVKVVLSGEGADELFGGYNIYRESLALKGFDYLPSPITKMLNSVALVLPEGVKGRSYLLRGTTPLADRYIGNAKIFNEEEKSKILTTYQNTNHFKNIVAPYYERAQHYDTATKMQFIDLHTWLPGDILTKADRMTMAHSLELRVPFLDNEVLEVASQIPTKYKLDQKTTKYILRQAISEWIPASVLDRKKLGFPVPIRVWLRNEWYDWAKETIHQSQTDDLLYKDKIIALLNEHAAGKKDNSRKLWVVLCFMIWHAIYVEKSMTPYKKLEKAEDFYPTPEVIVEK